MWGVQDPNYYMMGRLNVDPTQDVDDVMNQYYAAFGPAAKQVEKYFSYWEGITAKCTTEVKKAMTGGWASISTGGDRIFTPETFVTGRALLQDAKTAAAGDSGATSRVAYLEMWLQHADLCMQALAAYQALQKKPADKTLQETWRKPKQPLMNFAKRTRMKLSTSAFCARWKCGVAGGRQRNYKQLNLRIPFIST